MGVPGSFANILENITPTRINLKEKAGFKVVIDVLYLTYLLAIGLVNSGKFIVDKDGYDVTEIYIIFKIAVTFVVKYGMGPIFVFDGQTPSIKKYTTLKRNNAKNKSSEIINKALCYDLENLSKYSIPTNVIDIKRNINSTSAVELKNNAKKSNFIEEEEKKNGVENMEYTLKHDEDRYEMDDNDSQAKKQSDTPQKEAEDIDIETFLSLLSACSDKFDNNLESGINFDPSNVKYTSHDNVKYTSHDNGVDRMDDLDEKSQDDYKDSDTNKMSDLKSIVESFNFDDLSMPDEKNSEQYDRHRTHLKHLKRSYRPDPRNMKRAIKLLGFLGVPCIEASGEADAECAAIAMYDPDVLGIITSDFDHLVHNAPNILVMENFGSEYLNEYSIESVLNYMQEYAIKIIKSDKTLFEAYQSDIFDRRYPIEFTDEDLLNFCCLLGNDYFPGGLSVNKKASKNRSKFDIIFELYVRSGMDLDSVINNLQHNNALRKIFGSIDESFTNKIIDAKNEYLNVKVIPPERHNLTFRKPMVNMIRDFCSDFINECDLKKILKKLIRAHKKYMKDSSNNSDSNNNSINSSDNINQSSNDDDINRSSDDDDIYRRSDDDIHRRSDDDIDRRSDDDIDQRSDDDIEQNNQEIDRFSEAKVSTPQKFISKSLQRNRHNQNNSVVTLIISIVPI